MVLTKTPICEFGKKAEKFELKSTSNQLISLENIKGDKGTLIMFICKLDHIIKRVLRIIFDII